jgi:hypothetical protein
MSRNRENIRQMSQEQRYAILEQGIEGLANQRDEYKRQLDECQSKSRSNAYSQKPIPIKVSLPNEKTKYNTQVIERSFANPVSNSMSRTNLYNPQRWYSKGGKTRRRNNKNKNKSRKNRK